MARPENYRLVIRSHRALDLWGLALVCLVGFAPLSPAFARTACQLPPPGMSCPGDRLVCCNTPSLVYHFQGERYFGCTKTGEFLCQHDAEHKRCRPTRN